MQQLLILAFVINGQSFYFNFRSLMSFLVFPQCNINAMTKTCSSFFEQEG
jgi:hypothetical protein